MSVRYRTHGGPLLQEAIVYWHAALQFYGTALQMRPSDADAFLHAVRSGQMESGAAVRALGLQRHDCVVRPPNLYAH